MSYVKLVGTKYPHEGWSERVLLGDADDPKEVLQGVPVDLSDEECKTLKSSGFVLEDSSEDELDQVHTDEVEGNLASAPLLGPDSGVADQVKEVLAQTEDTQRVYEGSDVVEVEPQQPAPFIDPVVANPQESYYSSDDDVDSYENEGNPSVEEDSHNNDDSE